MHFIDNDFGSFWRSDAKKYCKEPVKVNISSENMLRGLDPDAQVGVYIAAKRMMLNCALMTLFLNLAN